MKRKIAVLLLLCMVCTMVFSGASSEKKLSGEEIYANSQGAVLYVRSLKADGALKTSGSGFVISKEGKVLTAYHVIRDAASIHAVFPSGEEVEMKLSYGDELYDIAVLTLPAGKTYSFLNLAAQAPSPGETVYAIGYPLKTTKVIHEGIVSNAETLINGLPRLLLNIDFASGMSGGPILNEQGTVVGITSATVRTINGDSTSPTLKQIQDALSAK